MARLHGSAETADGLAHDEGVHLLRVLIQVKRLGIGEEAGDLMVEQNAVGAE